MFAKKAGVTTLGENILYRYSTRCVLGLVTGRSIDMLKKPALPAYGVRWPGSSSSDNDVSTTKGTFSPDASLNALGERRRGDVNSVTWSVTYGTVSGTWSREGMKEMFVNWCGPAMITSSKLEKLDGCRVEDECNVNGPLLLLR